MFVVEEIRKNTPYKNILKQINQDEDDNEDDSEDSV